VDGCFDFISGRTTTMLDSLNKYKRFVIQALMVMMAVVLGLATIDLGWLIVKDILEPPLLILNVSQLIEIFGLFMLVIIGIELLETIMKTYLTPGRAHYEVVLTVAIIAIARKVIILDLKDLEPPSLVGIACIVISLTGGYYLMRKSHTGERES